MGTMTCFMCRILFLGATLCIVSANLMLEYNWPEPDPNIYRFPHESSCHFYYLRLSDEDISLEKCPDGQLFDYVKHDCTPDKEHVHCWSRHFGKMKHDHLLMKHKKHFKCPYPWGKFPNLHDCTKFHLCLNGKSKAKKCAPYELFDKISRKCIASIDAVCADKTDVVEHGYVCPKTWGSFIYSKDCSKYYECLQRKPTLRTCQKGKLFDDRLRRCQPEEHVYCGLRYNPYEKVSSDVPVTESVPNYSSSVEKSTTVGIDISAVTAAEKITSLRTIPSESELMDLENFPSTKEATSTQAAANRPISPSSVPENVSKETKQKENTPVVKPTDEVHLKEQQKTNDMEEKEVDTGKNEFVDISSTTEKQQAKTSSETVADDELEVLKKDVSTEDKDVDEFPISLAPVEALKIIPVTDISVTTVVKASCPPDDSMCTIEKDGTVVKCSNSKGIQPHPKDERRFLDCTGDKIQIYNCPLNLTFNPELKKCRWQFVMGSKKTTQ